MLTTLFFIFSIGVTLTHQRSISEWDELDTESDTDYHEIRSFTDETTNSECQCNWRLLRHYEAKGCEVVDKNACGCPLKFDCPNGNEIEENDKVCQYKGKKYSPGAVIDTVNPCESCRCTKSPQPRVVCSTVKCLNLNAPLEPGCHFLYEDTNQCCPTKITCDQYGPSIYSSKEQEEAFTCEYEGKKYPAGARMLSATDPCRICLCTEEWNVRNASCFQQDCVLEKYKAKLMDGCVPIYNEQTCCPVEFYCAPDDTFTSEHTEKEIPNVMEKADTMCAFGGRYYEIGKSLSINQDSTCVTCSCRVPPDFTCVHQSCASNPNEQNCQPYFTSDDCCPKYECLYGDGSSSENSDELTERELEDEVDGFTFTNSENPCIDVHCTEGRACMLYEVMCGNTSCPPVPTCMKTNSSCPTPQCADGCVVTEQDVDRCPTCVCGDEIKKRAADMVRCTMPQCFGRNCYLIADAEGCPSCSCDPPCPAIACDPGCNVISELEGQCPKCICEDETVGCPTPLCAHEGCRIENQPNGCPTCICNRHPSDQPANSELEREETHVHSVTSNDQLPQQHQQQEQEFEAPLGGSSYESSSSDDYDQISVITRRSPQRLVKTNTGQTHSKQLELDTEVRKKATNVSPAANNVNTAIEKDGIREP